MWLILFALSYGDNVSIRPEKNMKTETNQAIREARKKQKMEAKIPQKQDNKKGPTHGPSFL